MRACVASDQWVCGVCFQSMSCIPVFLLFPLRASDSGPMISSLNSSFLPHVISYVLLQSEPSIISRFKTSASLLNKVNCQHVKVATFHNMLRIVLACVRPCHLSQSLLLRWRLTVSSSLSCGLFLLPACPLRFSPVKTPFSSSARCIHQQAYKALLPHTHSGVILKIFNHCPTISTILSILAVHRGRPLGPCHDGR